MNWSLSNDDRRTAEAVIFIPLRSHQKQGSCFCWNCSNSGQPAERLLYSINVSKGVNYTGNGIKIRIRLLSKMIIWNLLSSYVSKQDKKYRNTCSCTVFQSVFPTFSNPTSFGITSLDYRIPTKDFFGIRSFSTDLKSWGHKKKG